MLDVYQMVTDRILQALENGVAPWRQPWSGGAAAISYATGKAYSFINQMLLGGVSGEYITFNEAKNAGGNVKRGEKGHVIVFWKMLRKEETDPDTGEVTAKLIPCLKYYTVFHLDQCENIKPRWRASEVPAVNPDLQPDDNADYIIDRYVARSGLKLHICESNSAFYVPASDSVTIPAITQYTQLSEYYSTAFHELTHSTGHPLRLNRLNEKAAFGSQVYSREELVAEMGAAMLVNFVRLESAASFANSTAYIDGWLHALRDDKKLVVIAASQAEKAVNYILGKGENLDDDPSVE